MFTEYYTHISWLMFILQQKVRASSLLYATVKDDATDDSIFDKISIFSTIYRYLSRPVGELRLDVDHVLEPDVRANHL
jgi:hypothetical protein